MTTPTAIEVGRGTRIGSSLALAAFVLALLLGMHALTNVSAPARSTIGAVELTEPARVANPGAVCTLRIRHGGGVPEGVGPDDTCPPPGGDVVVGGVTP